MHTTLHPQAGETVTVDLTENPHPQMPGVTEMQFEIDDWWDRLTGGSWMFADGNPAALVYAMRTGTGAGLPLDDEVVYGHGENGLGHLVHVSEIKKP